MDDRLEDLYAKMFVIEVAIRDVAMHMLEEGFDTQSVGEFLHFARPLSKYIATTSKEVKKNRIDGPPDFSRN